MKFIFYKKNKTTLIKHSLNNGLSALETLKKIIQRNLILANLNFKQNSKIGNYHFDFYSDTLKLAIDIDTYAHENKEILNTDTLKKLSIAYQNITVVRFTDYQILTDEDEIVRQIKRQINNSSKNTQKNCFSTTQISF